MHKLEIEVSCKRTISPPRHGTGPSGKLIGIEPMSNLGEVLLQCAQSIVDEMIIHCIKNIQAMEIIRLFQARVLSCLPIKFESILLQGATVSKIKTR